MKKGDSGKSQTSKSKEVVKIEKERKSSNQKPPDKAEVVASTDSKAKEELPVSSSSEKKKDGDDLNQNTAKEVPDLDVNETTSPSKSTEEQTTTKSNDLSVEKEGTDKVSVTISTPEEKMNANDQSAADASPKEEADKSTKTGKEGGDDTGESGGANVTEKDQTKAQDKQEDSPPSAKPTEESDTKTEDRKDETPATSTSTKVEGHVSTKVKVKIEETKAKDDTSSTAKPQEQAKEIVSKSPQPKDMKEPTAAPGSETTSQISSSEFACKLEIDKKTGQSEQSIVEAVEKSAEPTVTITRDVTTPA